MRRIDVPTPPATTTSLFSLSPKRFSEPVATYDNSRRGRVTIIRISRRIAVAIRIAIAAAVSHHDAHDCDQCYGIRTE